MGRKSEPHLEWGWVEGEVDTKKDHVRISYMEGDPNEPEAIIEFREDGTIHLEPLDELPPRQPMALVQPGEPGTFVVQFLVDADSTDAEGKRRLADVKRELDFYLVELAARPQFDPWWYVQYHCRSTANMYSKVRWSLWLSPASQAARRRQERPGRGWEEY